MKNKLTDKEIGVRLVIIILLIVSFGTLITAAINSCRISKVEKSIKIEVANESKTEHLQLEDPYAAYATVEINTNDGSQYYALISYRDVQKLGTPHEKITIWDSSVGYGRLMTDKIESYAVQ